MFPLFSLHAIAASRGDGLRPELLALFQRLADGQLIPVPSATSRGEKDSTARSGAPPQPEE